MTSAAMTRSTQYRPGWRGSGLQIKVRYGPTGPGIMLIGELDLCSGGQLYATLHTLAGRGVDVWLDLFNLRFCDCAGLRVFVRVNQELQHTGHRLALRHPSPQLRRLLSLTRLDQALAVA